jgi:hypothetical protein
MPYDFNFPENAKAAEFRGFGLERAKGFKSSPALKTQRSA